MLNEPRDVPLPLLISLVEADAIDRFRLDEELGTRAEAARLLIEIALETVSSRGQRFWDKPPVGNTLGRR